MRGACRDVALTCAYAVFDGDNTLCDLTDTNTCINSISEMFYNSMLCAEGEVYNNGVCVNKDNYDVIKLYFPSTVAKGLNGVLGTEFEWKAYYKYESDGKTKKYYDLVLPKYDEIFWYNADTAKYTTFTSWCYVPSGSDPNMSEKCVQFVFYDEGKKEYIFITPILPGADVKSIIENTYTTHKTIGLSYYRGSGDCVSSWYGTMWWSRGCMCNVTVDKASNKCTLPTSNNVGDPANYATCIKRVISKNSFDPSNKTYCINEIGSGVYHRSLVAFNFVTENSLKNIADTYCAVMFTETDSSFSNGFCSKKNVKKFTFGSKHLCIMEQNTALSNPRTSSNCLTSWGFSSYAQPVLNFFYGTTDTLTSVP
jgi:hypothetical protein